MDCCCRDQEGLSWPLRSYCCCNGIRVGRQWVGQNGCY
uniref:Uncharacterized protein n=1 Tax=Rhizophora mucronata TaxID=61149 RepID=A0A2P2NBD3_RHIMU